jgi:hypothetical protein
MSIYHLNVRVGTRAKGHSAKDKCDYIFRQGRFASLDRKRCEQKGLPIDEEDEVLFAASENMPSWAVDDPYKYWSASDRFERKNGVLFRTVEFALPVEMDQQHRERLALEFARNIAKTEGGLLPFSLAIHRGKEHNPHCHLLLSERTNDHIDRSPKMWFRRAAPKGKDRATGGARKAGIGNDSAKRKKWLEDVRKKWQDIHNFALLKWRINAPRIDHRSLREQGIDRMAQVHLGPGIHHLLLTREVFPEQFRDRVSNYVAIAETNQSGAAKKYRIAQLEQPGHSGKEVGNA